MPTGNKIAIHNKLNKNLKIHSNSKFTSNSRALKSFQFAHITLSQDNKHNNINKIDLITMD